MPGYPIRTPSDHSSVDSSPRLIAASHVLHRLLMPRHPPYALNNLPTTNTTQTSRCSHPLYNSQTPTSTTTPTATHPTTRQSDAMMARHPETTTHHTNHGCCLRTQQRTNTPPPPNHHTPLSTPTPTQQHRRDQAVLRPRNHQATATQPAVPHSSKRAHSSLERR